MAVAVSAVIAIPVGMVIGHTGRGTFLVVTGVNALRALPTLGVLLLGVLLWGSGPAAANGGVDAARHSAAAGRHLRRHRERGPDRGGRRARDGDEPDAGALRVELPNALPLILGGLRTATLQVVATATIAAYASLGGLGRYLIDGIKVRQFYIALVGALMVTALALILDALLGTGGVVIGAGHRSAAEDAGATDRRRGFGVADATHFTDRRRARATRRLR